MSNLIYTIMMGSDPSYPLVERNFQDYANKVGAKLLVLKKPLYHFDSYPLKCKHLALFQKFYVKELLKKHTRVLYLDADLLITSKADNIFEKFPDGQCYFFNEGQYIDAKGYIEALPDVNMKAWAKSQGNFIYYNAGVMLFSRLNNPLDYVDIDMVADDCVSLPLYEQTYLNGIIMKNNLQVGSLEYAWNRIQFSDERPEDRFNAHFIHYAGLGYSKKRKLRYQQIMEDYKRMYGFSFGKHWFNYWWRAKIVFRVWRLMDRFICSLKKRVLIRS